MIIDMSLFWRRLHVLVIGVLTEQGVQHLRLLHLALVLVAEGGRGAAISTHFQDRMSIATSDPISQLLSHL